MNIIIEWSKQSSQTITTNKQQRRQHHDQRKTLGIQSTVRRRESISKARQQIRKDNDTRASCSWERTMQTIIDLGQAARPFIIICLAAGTLLSLPVLLSLADTDKDD